ncbi:MAG TPA: TRAP transporter TatT component family protein [Polyangiaceae bacterium]|nr:TRAP transporter TatT component family protein [Polyangiaceae bacterium]
MSAKSYPRFRVVGPVLLWLCAGLGSGCSINKIAADGTASLMNEAAPALDGLWDYELVGAGMPGTILQLEALWSISPDNELLSLNLAKAYLGYTLGWVEAEYEKAYFASDMDKADRLRQRARLLYLRARNLALRTMRNRDRGIDEALKSTSDQALAQYLAKHYKDKDDVAPVFWAGMTWGAAINVSLDQPDLIADAATARTLVERAKALDDGFFNGGAYIFLGSLEAGLPVMMGGNPDKGREYFEAGLARTERKNHMLLVMYARTYAVNTQNRELFVKLLTEVIDAPDLGPAVRLNNKIARRRAERYLAQADQLF